jgi:lysophospholipase L1-like esterase
VTSPVRQRLALTAGTVFVFLLMAEGAARFFAPVSWLPGDPDPDWTIHERSPDPLLAYALRPRSSVTFPRWGGEGTIRYDIDEAGLREVAGFTGEKAPGTFRILVVGDSVAFGLGVGEDERLGPRLVRELQARSAVPLDSVTLAVCGYDALQAVHLLRTRGAALRPDLVLLVYNLTDTMHFSGELGRFFERLAQGEPLPGDAWRRRFVPWSRFVRWIFGRLYQARGRDDAAVERAGLAIEEARVQRIRDVFARHPTEAPVSRVAAVPPVAPPPLPAPWDEIEAAYRDPDDDRRRHAALLDLRDFAEEQKVPVQVALVPAFLDRRPYPFAPLEDALAAEMQALGFGTTVLRAALDDAPAAALSYDTVHPTARGTERLAQHLAPKLAASLPSSR